MGRVPSYFDLGQGHDGGGHQYEGEGNAGKDGWFSPTIEFGQLVGQAGFDSLDRLVVEMPMHVIG